MASGDIERETEKEINQLELLLSLARARFKYETFTSSSALSRNIKHSNSFDIAHLETTPHALLLLSDSALPLGSFAFSSGLESFLAHRKALDIGQNPTESFIGFLRLSIKSLAGTSIPYLLAAYRDPAKLELLDNDLDASTPCAVARRASIAQGRALLSVWERAFRSAKSTTSIVPEQLLASFSVSLRSTTTDSNLLGTNGHFAPLWALICNVMNLQLEQSAYVFLFNHAKAVISAAVRASVLGPYQAQGMLASGWLQSNIHRALEENWTVRVEDAGQAIPLLDLWIGRHELLYSRIFNS